MTSKGRKLRLSVGLIPTPSKTRLITEARNKSYRNNGERTTIKHTPKDDFIADGDASMISTDQSRKGVRRRTDTLANPKKDL